MRVLWMYFFLGNAMLSIFLPHTSNPLRNRGVFHLTFVDKSYIYIYEFKRLLERLL